MRPDVLLRSIWRGMQMAARGPLWALMGTGAAVGTSWDTERSDSMIVPYRMGVAKVYKGSLCMLNAAGYLMPAADTETGQCFAGVASETIDNSGGAVGDKWMNVWTTGVFTFKASGDSLAVTDVGLPAYIGFADATWEIYVKNGTIGSHPIICGKIVGVSTVATAKQVRVLIDYAAASGAASA